MESPPPAALCPAFLRSSPPISPHHSSQPVASFIAAFPLCPRARAVPKTGVQGRLLLQFVLGRPGVYAVGEVRAGALERSECSIPRRLKRHSSAGAKRQHHSTMTNNAAYRSLTGDAHTAIFVCLSQAPKNNMQSSVALDFGEVFSKLSINPRAKRWTKKSKMKLKAAATLAGAKAAISTAVASKGGAR